MKCPNCQNSVPINIMRCHTCGYDLRIYGKLYALSNIFYNKGLEKARVRDLTGAIIMLKKSLKVIKDNVKARNLLGLVHYEMGETVSALSEWVISKDMDEDDGEAERFLSTLQSNPAKLESNNQAIKKYNIALDVARQGSDDIAIIQLKKVVSMQPNFLRAAHLLALLHIKNGEFNKARRVIDDVAGIDISNTTTLRYLAEIRRHESNDDDKRAKNANKGAGIAPITKYREYKPNVLAWVNWFLGFAIGVAVIFVLVVPTAKKNIREEYDRAGVDYAAELNVLTATISSYEKEVAALRIQLEEKDDEINNFKEAVFDPDMYDQFFILLKEYQGYATGEVEYDDDALYYMAKEFYNLTDVAASNYAADDLHQDITAVLYPLAAGITFARGKELYDEGGYEEALDLLYDSYLFSSRNPELIYYLGFTYQMLGQLEDASTYYDLLTSEYTGTAYANEAKKRLNEMGN